MKKVVQQPEVGKATKVNVDMLRDEISKVAGLLPGPGTMAIGDRHSVMGTAILLVDCSGTMAEHGKLDSVKDGTLDFAKNVITKGYNVGIIVFDTDVTEICPPISDLGVIRSKLVGLRAGGITNMARAIDLGRKKLRDLTGNRVMLIVTDGMPNGDDNDPQTSLNMAALARKDGITIYARGTDDATQSFLTELTG